MEQAKTTRKKSAKQVSPDLIVTQYKTYLLENGVHPTSVYKFCLDLGIKEEEFYNYFGSFEAIDRFIWKTFATSTIDRLISDESFGDFSSREKLLTFYFAFAEVLKTNRSYILLTLKVHTKPELLPDFLKDLKIAFAAFTEGIIQEGLQKNEIATRPFLDKRYAQLFWVHMNFFLLYWKADTSKGFESSDAFIEKSINLAFELIGKGALDTAVDFMKFLYQSKMKG